MKNTFLSELDKHIIIYGSIWYFQKAKENNKVDLITPRNKLKFSVEKDVYKEKVRQELSKVTS